MRDRVPVREADPSPQPRRWSARKITLWITLLVYALLTLGIMVHTPLLDMDRWFYGLHLHVDYPQYERFILDYVMFGQRGPATLVFLPYFFWVAWRTRSTRPLVMLGTSLVLLNVSVGVVKLLTGRLGPQQTRLVHADFRRRRHLPVRARRQHGGALRAGRLDHRGALPQGRRSRHRCSSS